MRPLVEEDAADLLHAIGDYDILKMTASWDWPIDEAYVREKIKGYTDQSDRQQTGFGIFIDGQLAGNIGAHLEPGCPQAVIGYMIGKRWWGKGYVSEIVPPFCRHVFEVLQPETILGGHYADNPASGRVMEKAGFQLIGPAKPLYSKARQAEADGFDYILTPDKVRL